MLLTQGLALLTRQAVGAGALGLGAILQFNLGANLLVAGWTGTKIYIERCT